MVIRNVVSYRNSTSNHNLSAIIMAIRRLYLIEILHQTTTDDYRLWLPDWLYLIEILHQTTTSATVEQCPKGCILSKFYIKPQLLTLILRVSFSCILSKFYIKPQQRFDIEIPNPRCILSKFYIKPQLSVGSLLLRLVVSYRNSTSNHNVTPFARLAFRLYLIEILHQTTTSGLILIDKVLLTGCLPL